MIEFAILTFLGLLIGALVSRYVGNEVNSGRKYFVFFYKAAIFVLLLLSLFYAWYVQISHLVIVFLAGIIISIAISEIYFYLGGLFLLAFWEGQSYFNVVIVMIFILGLIKGMFLGTKYKKFNFYIKKIFVSAIFFAIPFFMIYYKSLVLPVDNVIYALISGAIFAEFVKKVDL